MGQTIGLLSPYIDTRMMNILLKQFASELDPGTHAVMIWDQAGFPCSKDLKTPDNVSIIPIPPYSAELTPIETL